METVVDFVVSKNALTILHHKPDEDWQTSSRPAELELGKQRQPPENE